MMSTDQASMQDTWLARGVFGEKFGQMESADRIVRRHHTIKKEVRFANARVASVSTVDESDSTRDASESESLSSDGAGSTYQPVEESQQYASGQRNGACSMAHRYAPVSAANSPADFAAAFRAVSQAGAWKRDDLEGTAKGAPKNQRDAKKSTKGANTAPAKADVRKGIVEQMPFPKWFCPSKPENNSMNPVMPSRAVAAPLGLVPRGMLEPNEFEQGFSVAHGYCASVEQERATPTADCDRPLKVQISILGCPASKLNPSMPCKKRVPDWGF
jgi:hypothetical protein